MTFDEALKWMHQGQKVARAGWPCRGMFLYIVPGSHFTVNRWPLMGILPEGTPVTYKPHIDMRFADGEFGVWTPTQDDILEDDWEVVYTEDFLHHA